MRPQEYLLYKPPVKAFKKIIKKNFNKPNIKAFNKIFQQWPMIKAQIVGNLKIFKKIS